MASSEEPLVLRGRFLLLRALGAAASEAESPHLRLAEPRPFTRFRDRELLGDDDLVIHIRAGEVFRKERVNRVYGPPPLAWGGPPGVEQVDVVDDRGDYRRAVLSSNWEHRPDQVDLMLRYPQSGLRLVSAAERQAMGTGESGISPASRTA